MIIEFFKSSGAQLVEVLEAKKTIDNMFYVENILDPFVQRIKLIRIAKGISKIKILHDYARSHFYSNVKEYLKSERIIISGNAARTHQTQEIKKRLPAQIDQESLGPAV